MIQQIKDRIIEVLGGYTAEQHNRMLDRLEWRICALESEAATESARSRYGIATLRVKAEVNGVYEEILKEDIKGELVHQLAKAIKPHVKIGKRPSAKHGLIEYFAEITVVKGAKMDGGNDHE